MTGINALERSGGISGPRLSAARITLNYVVRCQMDPRAG
jgi:hypothetical protein